MKLALIGATGLVGQVALKVLEKRNFPLTELIPVASERSIGKAINFRGQQYKVVGIENALSMSPELAIFSAGAGTSLKWAPKFARLGTRVIDNSSAWRMDTEKKLIVPEVNARALRESDRIIANPNCSTIQLVMVLAPLHKSYAIKRVVVSTYQSVSGTGMRAVKQLHSEIKGGRDEAVYPYPIFKNVLPHCDVFEKNGYTKEEMKLVRESVKILEDDSFSLTATAVRVPVEGGHSESVNVEFHTPFELEDIRTLLSKSPGIVLQDNPSENAYPMPIYAKDKDEVFVGRIRRDESQPNSLNLWIVSDNLRKGAATNAVQIAEYLSEKGWVWFRCFGSFKRFPLNLVRK